MTRVFLPHVITDDSALGGSEIERSLRFIRSDSHKLNRTFGTNTSNTTKTLSFWMKRATMGAYQTIFGTTSSGYIESRLQFTNTDELQFTDRDASSGSTDIQKITNRKFRDIANWYNIVFVINTTDGTADDRIKIYVNGTQETSFSSSTNPSSSYDVSFFRSSVDNFIGANNTSDFFDGYLAEINFIDGQALDASYFGYTEFQTGLWRPKRYEGTYGNNGFHLELKDNSSTSTLGKDTSGNGNDFTANNFSVSAGVGNDSMIDTPTHNYATLNSLHWNVLYGAGGTSNGDDFTQANLRFVSPSSVTSPYNRATSSTISVDSGKWYFEATQENSDNGVTIGFSEVDSIDSNGYYTGSWGFNHWDQRKLIAGTETSYGAKPSNNDVLGYAFDLDKDTMELFINNSSQGLVTGLGISGKTVVMTAKLAFWTNKWVFNFGQQGFTYTPPTGYKALESSNVPPKNVPSIIRPQKHFSPILYTGNGGTNNITGLEFEPDMIWIKSRGQAYAPYIFDRLRDNFADNLRTDSNAQEPTDGTALTGVFEHGFSTSGSSGINDSGSGTDGFVAWCWKAGGAAVSNTDGNITTSCSANQEAGFSIITYTGTGAQTTVGHGLGKAPKVMITKLRDTTTQDWFFNPGEITGTRGKYIKFNTSDGEATDAHTYPDVAATSTVYTIGGDDGGNGSNGNGSAYVAYCWAEIPGYSKFDTYIGNGDSFGPYVHLGFRPAWILLRRQTGDNWVMKDSTRNTTNDVYSNLIVNGTNVEFGSASDVNSIDFVSNGFKIRGSNSAINSSGETFIYMAFAEQPGTTAFDTFPNAR